MNTQIKVSAQYKDQPPTVMLDLTASHPMAAAHAFESAQKLITKLIDMTGNKMPLVKLKVTVGHAPRSMGLYRSDKLSGLHHDVFLFGNLNLLDPDRTQRSASYKIHQPPFSEDIFATPRPVQIHNQT